MSTPDGPVLIELDEPGEQTPASAPLVPDLATPDFAGVSLQGQAVQTLAVLAGRRGSRLWRWFWAATVGVVGLMVSVAAWDFVFGLLARNIWLGRVALFGVGVVVVTAIGLALREWIFMARLRKVDGLRRQSERVRISADLGDARALVARVSGFYRGRDDLRLPLDDLAARSPEILDADGLLDAAERALMPSLDAAARREVEGAARQVAMITAIVPLAMIDVVTALIANLRMVRRIAEIYGGRAGSLGSWRLLKAVLLHLVATGAVAVGDDLIHSIAGGGLISKISRRFGEGVVNGALTARVGVAAMELCRPLPFAALKKPGVTGLVKSALAGLFSRR